MGLVLDPATPKGDGDEKDRPIAVMDGVREYSDGLFPVELWRNAKTGRLVIRAYNERGNNITEVDLWDLLDWLQTGQPQWLLADSASRKSDGFHIKRD